MIVITNAKGAEAAEGPAGGDAEAADHAGHCGAVGLCRPGAAHGLSYRRHRGHGRRSAAQSRQVGDGAIDTASTLRAVLSHFNKSDVPPLGKANCYTAVTAPTKVFGYLLHVGGG